jgi:hypothetical protein
MKKPESVAILGLGPSVNQFLELAKRLGGSRSLASEVWGINALGDVIRCDRIFHMDDVRIQEARAAAKPQSNIARMLEWMKEHPGPIYTSRTHPNYPGLVEFPIEKVINDTKFAYMNSTAAYAVAYAVYLRVKKIYLFGCDFTYPNAHDAEKGRACVEFWLGMAAARGIEISVPQVSSLMDAMYTQQDRLYGNDTRDVRLTRRANGTIKVTFKEKEIIPSAEEIEAKYDHSAHPNALVK